jgi:hypothetical protein
VEEELATIRQELDAKHAEDAAEINACRQKVPMRIVVW